MAKPTINLCGLKCLVKILISIAIILIIVVVAFLIVGNLSISKLKLDQVKLGETTLADLGLADMSTKAVFTAAYKLCTADEADFVTNPYEDKDKTAVNNIFSSLPKVADGTPRYAALLEDKASFGADKLYTVTDKGLAHIFNQVFATTGAIPSEVAKLGLRVKSTTITEDKQLVVTFAINVESITKDLPKILFLDWPTESYLQYTAKINVSNQGAFGVTDPSFTINGVDDDATKALLTALATTLQVEVATGETLDGVILDTIEMTTTTVIANMGAICHTGTTAAGIAQRDDVVYAGNAGIKDGEFSFIKYL